MRRVPTPVAPGIKAERQGSGSRASKLPVLTLSAAVPALRNRG